VVGVAAGRRVEAVVLGPVVLLGAYLTFLLGIPYAFVGAVRFTRRLTGVPPRPLPEPPRPEPDGLFRDGRRLRRSAWWIRHHDLVGWAAAESGSVTGPIVRRLLAFRLVLDQLRHGPRRPLTVLAALTTLAGIALLWPWLWWPVVRPFYAYEVSLAGLGAGLVLTALGLARMPSLVRPVSTVDRTPADELRRIERDLHDGSQATLLAIGMKLGAIEALMDADPRAAKAVVAEARDVTAFAVHELGDLVRGAPPPVLVERGLVEAVRSLGAACPLRVTVRGAPPVHLEKSLATALYFAVAELLTNAAKHSGGTRAEVRFAADGVAVEDDGRGGASVHPGGGLAGIGRRLAPFGGRVVVDGATVRLRVPLGGGR
jgi:signal transduction histidine kinase